MRKLFFIFILSVSSVHFLSAQNYNTALGIRAGAFNGVSLKHFLSSRHAVEGILSFRWQGFSVTGLYEIHDQAFDVQGLQWYYGFGAHVGFWDGRNVRWTDGVDNQVILGVDGIIGLEYNFAEIPINISLDWKPALNLIGYSGFWADGGAISVRYLFR